MSEGVFGHIRRGSDTDNLKFKSLILKAKGGKDLRKTNVRTENQLSGLL